MKIFVTGATGLLGSHLCKALKTGGHEVWTVTRSEKNFLPLSQIGCVPVLGDVARKPAPHEAWTQILKSCDCVINLVGAPILDRRWSPAFKEVLRISRVESTRRIAGLVSAPDTKVRVMISGSATGYYGSDVAGPLDEFSPAGKDFLARLCVSWERAACISKSEVRTVFLRSGIVLSPIGGALKKMLPFFRLGLGGRLGGGQQMMSWIHISDWVQAVLMLLDEEQLRGPYNLTAPYAITNSQFTHTLAALLRRPAVFPVPAAVMKMFLGESSSAVLGNQQVRPLRLLDAGFNFSFPDIHQALSNLLRYKSIA